MKKTPNETNFIIELKQNDYVNATEIKFAFRWFVSSDMFGHKLRASSYAFKYGALMESIATAWK